MTGAASSSALPRILPRKILAAVFAVGFSCLITQLVFMREALAAFSGNELVLGVVLGNWLLIMGIGTSFGRLSDRLKKPGRALAIILVFIAVLPSAQIVLLRGLRQFVFLRGVSLGVTETVLTSFLILLPYCLLAGFSLTLACSLLARREKASITFAPMSLGEREDVSSQGAGQVYMIDSLGSVLGGALFSFVLVLWFDHFAALWLPAMLNLLVAVWLTWPAKRDHGLIGPLLAAGAAGLGLAWLVWVIKADPDKASTAMQIPGQRLLFLGSSPYGRLVVSEAGGQTNFFENGLLLAASPNIEQAEETAHYAMAQRPGAKRVLLIGGLLSGIAKEILRHDVSEVDCVDIDPLVASVARQFLPKGFGEPRLRSFAADARQFVRTTDEKYDVIIVALPDPATAQLNRFFTHEFFQETRRILQPGGILSFAVGRYENYAGAELVRLLSCARQTALKSFPNLLLIPGGRVYFITSDGPLTLDIASALEAKGLTLRLVNRHYLKATLAPDRVADLERSASQPSPLNRDFKPILYLLQLRYWASQFTNLSRWLTGSALALACFYLLRLRGAACAIFTSGFAGSALEIALLLGLQVLAGSVYRQVGLVVTLFMAGLAIGAGLGTRSLAKVRPAPQIALPFHEPGAKGLLSPSLSSRGGEGAARPARLDAANLVCILALFVAGLAFMAPQLLGTLSAATKFGLGQAAAQWLIALFSFGLALVVGAQFPLANRVEEQNRLAPTRLYTADFIGASIGALLTSTLLVPSVGIVGVCCIAGAMNLLAAPLIFWKGKTR
jgi:spermidine synthase